MNVDLLLHIKREILRTPDRFCAAHWAFARNAHDVIRESARPDGFKCCLAGHALLLDGRSDERGLLCRSGLHNSDGSLYQRAGEALRLSRAQQLELFFPSQWDAPFKQRYYLCSRDEETTVCAEYIDYFMDKHGVEVSQAASAGAGLEQVPVGQAPAVAA